MPQFRLKLYSSSALTAKQLQGPNLYRYAANNPSNMTDRLGTQSGRACLDEDLTIELLYGGDEEAYRKAQEENRQLLAAAEDTAVDAVLTTFPMPKLPGPWWQEMITEQIISAFMQQLFNSYGAPNPPPPGFPIVGQPEPQGQPQNPAQPSNPFAKMSGSTILYYANKAFELLFPIWMVLVNMILGVAFLCVHRRSVNFFTMLLLSISAFLFSFVNLTYALVNWRFVTALGEFVKITGHILLWSQIIAAVFASLLTLTAAVYLLTGSIREGRAK